MRRTLAAPGLAAVLGMALKNSIVKCNNFLLIFLYILSHHNKAVNIHSFVGSLL